jgi:hypothetical protein
MNISISGCKVTVNATETTYKSPEIATTTYRQLIRLRKMYRVERNAKNLAIRKLKEGAK